MIRGGEWVPGGGEIDGERGFDAETRRRRGGLSENGTGPAYLVWSREERRVGA